MTEIGFAEAPEIATFVGTDDAVSVTLPRFEGFQGQVTEKLAPEPVAKIFLQPAIVTFEALKVIFEATDTLAEIFTVVLKIIGVAIVNELKEDVSKTSVTVIVIDCVPEFAAVSVAVSVNS